MKLFFIKKRVIKSHEGTTKANQIAMAMYGVAILLLIDMLKDENLNHKWYTKAAKFAVDLNH